MPHAAGAEGEGGSPRPLLRAQRLQPPAGAWPGENREQSVPSRSPGCSRDSPLLRWPSVAGRDVRFADKRLRHREVATRPGVPGVGAEPGCTARALSHPSHLPRSRRQERTRQWGLRGGEAAASRCACVKQVTARARRLRLQCPEAQWAALHRTPGPLRPRPSGPPLPRGGRPAQQPHDGAPGEPQESPTRGPRPGRGSPMRCPGSPGPTGFRGSSSLAGVKKLGGGRGPFRSTLPRTDRKAGSVRKAYTCFAILTPCRPSAPPGRLSAWPPDGGQLCSKSTTAHPPPPGRSHSPLPLAVSFSPQILMGPSPLTLSQGCHGDTAFPAPSFFPTPQSAI